MRVVQGNENLHTLWMSSFPLGVFCARCGHKAVLPQEAAGAQRANMTELRSLGFRCESCKRRGTAASGDVVLYLFSGNDEVDQFTGKIEDDF